MKYIPEKSGSNSRQPRQHWVVLMVNTHGPTSHTKVERIGDMLGCLTGSFPLKGGGTHSMVPAVCIDAVTPEMAASIVEVTMDSENTVRGNVSRSVLFELVAQQLNLECWTDYERIFKIPNVEKHLKRVPFAKLQRV
jgi:hypothetical protein